MNTLSWMIYLAGVAESISVVCSLTGIVFLIIAAFKTLAVFGDDFERGHPETKSAAKAFFTGAGKIAIPLLLVATFLPSKASLYAIAASEMGERALTSETGGKAVKALNAWLDRQIAGEGPSQ